MTRRDQCHLIGKQASLLTETQAAEAWGHLAAHVEVLAEKDIPKFIDLLQGIRQATIAAKRPVTKKGAPAA